MHYFVFFVLDDRFVCFFFLLMGLLVLMPMSVVGFLVLVTMEPALQKKSDGSLLVLCGTVLTRGGFFHQGMHIPAIWQIDPKLSKSHLFLSGMPFRPCITKTGLVDLDHNKIYPENGMDMYREDHPIVFAFSSSTKEL